MAVKKLPVSFKESEQYIRDYITSKLNYSAYIKELVIKDIESNIKVEKPSERGSAIVNGGFDF